MGPAEQPDLRGPDRHRRGHGAAVPHRLVARPDGEGLRHRVRGVHPPAGRPRDGRPAGGLPPPSDHVTHRRHREAGRADVCVRGSRRRLLAQPSQSTRSHTVSESGLCAMRAVGISAHPLGTPPARAGSEAALRPRRSRGLGCVTGRILLAEASSLKNLRATRIINQGGERAISERTGPRGPTPETTPHAVSRSVCSGPTTGRRARGRHADHGEAADTQTVGHLNDIVGPVQHAAVRLRSRQPQCPADLPRGVAHPASGLLVE